jgi:5-formyltetrahydrofolate cyclo-ligase
MSDPRDRLRREIRKRRAALPAATRIEAADALAERIGELPELLTDDKVAGYWAVHGELPLHRVVTALVRRGAQYHLPVVCTGERLRFAPWAPGKPLTPNRFGIPEPTLKNPKSAAAPESIELVLVPLLAFDRKGNRIGSGGGYYDRSFSFLRNGERPREPLLVGIAYGFQEVPHLAPESWDIKLDFVCTEDELIECGKG